MLCWLPYCLYAGTLRLLRMFGVVKFNWDMLEVSRLLYRLTMLNSFVDPFI